MINTLLLTRAEGQLTTEIPEGSVLLKTCNRTGLYWGDGDIPTKTARHLFRVAAGLESPLLGEMAIQGQLKQAYHEAVNSNEHKLSAPLNRLFQNAIHVGHRVRIETGIAKGAVSYSQVTVDIFCRELPELGNKVVSIFGVNDLTEAILNFLTARGATNIILANRSFAKAEAMAERYNAEALPLSEKRKMLEVSDVVISATSAPHTIINVGDFFPNDRRSTLLFDLAFPHDIAGGVGELPNKKVYSLEMVEQEAKQNLAAREQEVAKCEAIIEEEIAELKRWENYRKEKLS